MLLKFSEKLNDFWKNRGLLWHQKWANPVWLQVVEAWNSFWRGCFSVAQHRVDMYVPALKRKARLLQRFVWLFRIYHFVQVLLCTAPDCFIFHKAQRCTVCVQKLSKKFFQKIYKWLFLDVLFPKIWNNQILVVGNSNLYLMQLIDYFLLCHEHQIGWQRSRIHVTTRLAWISSVLNTCQAEQAHLEGHHPGRERHSARERLQEADLVQSTGVQESSCDHVAQTSQHYGQHKVSFHCRNFVNVYFKNKFFQSAETEPLQSKVFLFPTAICIETVGLHLYIHVCTQSRQMVTT